MKIRSIHIYSHDGQRRDLRFKVDGLNVITGRSSTGKSALSDIIEYCMGRSSFNVPEGIIRDKVSWFAVIYQFEKEQVLIAKPTPPGSGASCSTAMLRRGTQLQVPEFKDLAVNTDDDSIVELLSRLLEFPRTAPKSRLSTAEIVTTRTSSTRSTTCSRSRDWSPTRINFSIARTSSSNRRRSAIRCQSCLASPPTIATSWNPSCA
ncbi:hypothetical protein [Xanthomonas arboricola]|uniref:hypothetical protein n=1 Tax=Xanthomonas arboricola TaxID=56448 RepID=UPI0023B91A3D|nr:hypothetical protein [Xanthomonas arboricola]